MSLEATPYHETFWNGGGDVNANVASIEASRYFDWKDLHEVCTHFITSGESISPNAIATPAPIVQMYEELKRMQRNHRGRPSPVRITIPDHVIMQAGGSLFVAALHLHLDTKHLSVEPVDVPEFQYDVTFTV
jgi:hypothetical protein